MIERRLDRVSTSMERRHEVILSAAVLAAVEGSCRGWIERFARASGIEVARPSRTCRYFREGRATAVPFALPAVQSIRGKILRLRTRACFAQDDQIVTATVN